MKKFVTDLGIGALPLLLSVYLGLQHVAMTHFGISAAILPGDVEKHARGTPMHGVQLTQKGYIQFLRWELPVPDIHEFTFCLWVKSFDLKHPHSILSYSRNERERLIRSWISSGGRSVHLEINGAEIFRWPVRIREHRWHHVCQSWENRPGRYALWLDGHLEMQGRSVKMIDHVIPGNGDIVLGQEYTDFDKGLEEGIEGSVLGFNLLLASAFDSLDNGYQRPFQSIDVAEPSSLVSRIRTRMARRRDSDLDGGLPLTRLALDLDSNWSRRISRSDNEAIALENFAISPNVNGTRREATSSIRERAIIASGAADDSTGEVARFERSSIVPLGLQLVKLSYVRCQLGRGSPPIGGPLMLISWSRTPVKIFGGAIVKNVGNKCGKF